MRFLNEDIDQPETLNISHGLEVTIIIIELIIRLCGIIACFYLIVESKKKYVKIKEPSPWVDNYDETYCSVSLKLVKMVKFQLHILVLCFSSDMVLCVF